MGRARDPVADWPQAELRTEPPAEPLPDPDPPPASGERLPPLVATADGSISQRAFDLRLKLCAAQRIDPEEPRCIGDAYQIQQWLAKGWSAEIILETVEIVMSRRESPPGSLRYYEQAIARTVAEHAQPLPKITINQTDQKVHHGRNGSPRKIDGFDQIKQQLREHLGGGGLAHRNGAEPLQIVHKLGG